MLGAQKGVVVKIKQIGDCQSCNRTMLLVIALLLNGHCRRDGFFGCQFG